MLDYFEIVGIPEYIKNRLAGKDAEFKEAIYDFYCKLLRNRLEFKIRNVLGYNSELFDKEMKDIEDGLEISVNNFIEFMDSLSYPAECEAETREVV